jgi:tRNA (guanosine-2'-O-)-methyltransferase
MNRDDDDVFLPTSHQFSGPPGAGSTLFIPPGPTPEWTANGIIDALSELTGKDRRVRLQSILEKRLSSVTMVLDHPHDPHNGSAVMRSCDAFGVQQIHIIRGQENFAASRTVSMGSERWIDMIEHRHPDPVIHHLRASGFRTLVTHPQGRLTPEDLGKLDKVALILGNERDGVSAELSQAADDTVQIPMCGFVESLNVSVSAAILLRAATRGRPGDLTAQERENTYARWLRKSVPRSDEVLSALKPC